MGEAGGVKRIFPPLDKDLEFLKQAASILQKLLLTWAQLHNTFLKLETS